MGRIALFAGLLFLSALAQPTRAEEGSFDSAGVKIAYTVQGKGEPVLLIHGYRASAFSNWQMPGVVDLLARNYQVITIDNRGHGKSDKPESPEAYGEKMAEDSVRLLDHLKIKKAHIVGYSMGGMITMKLLAKHPDRINSAVVGGMGWYDEKPGSRVDGGGEGRGNNKALEACASRFYELSVTKDDVMGIKLPVTVLIGDNDGLRKRVDPLAAARPDIPVVMIKDSIHTNAFFKPQFKEALSAFLAAHSGSGRK